MQKRLFSSIEANFFIILIKCQDIQHTETSSLSIAEFLFICLKDLNS